MTLQKLITSLLVASLGLTQLPFVFATPCSPDKLTVEGVTLQNALRVNATRIEKLTTLALLQQFADQHKVAFVIEGDLLATSFVRQARHLSPDSAKPVEEQVATLALACDYDAKFQGGVFVWTRRYKADMDAVPDITLDEAIVTTTNLETIVAPFRPSTMDEEQLTFGTFPRQYIRSLDKEQREMLTGNKPEVDGSGNWPASSPSVLRLNISELPADRKNLVWQYALTTYVGQQFEALGKLSDKLKQIKTQTPTFYFDEYSSGKVFSLRCSTAKSGHVPGSIPLGDPYAVSLNGGRFAVGKVKKDRTAPTPTDTDGSPQNLIPTQSSDSIGLTVGEAISRFGDGSVEVDERIKDKGVTIVVPIMGSPETFAKELPASIASVYGLNLSDDGTRSKLSLKRLPYRNNDITQLSSAILQALPQPLVRAISGSLTQEAEADAKNRGGELIPPVTRSRALETIRIRATKQLRTIVEPKIKKSPQGEVYLSSLTKHEEHLTASLLLSLYLPSVGKYTEKVPDYISHFEDMILICYSNWPSKRTVDTMGQGNSPIYHFSICRPAHPSPVTLTSVTLFNVDRP